jgi:hypothetical protein
MGRRHERAGALIVGGLGVGLALGLAATLPDPADAAADQPGDPPLTVVVSAAPTPLPTAPPSTTATTNTAADVDDGVADAGHSPTLPPRRVPGPGENDYQPALQPGTPTDRSPGSGGVSPATATATTTTPASTTDPPGGTSPAGGAPAPNGTTSPDEPSRITPSISLARVEGPPGSASSGTVIIGAAVSVVATPTGVTPLAKPVDNAPPAEQATSTAPTSAAARSLAATGAGPGTAVLFGTAAAALAAAWLMATRRPRQDASAT